MDHEDNDQLLSAYLDGELSADQRAEVEQLLATSDEARQLIEELQTIRASLKSLPQHRLDPDFAQSVVRLAEQEKLIAAPNATKTDSQQAAFLPQHDPWQQPSAFRSWRGIGWSIVAVAAAVAILVATRQDDQNDRKIARAPAPANAQSQPMVAESKPTAPMSAPMPALKATPQIAADEPQKKLQREPSENAASAAATSPEPLQLGSAESALSKTEAPAPASPAGALSADSESDANAVLVVQVGLKPEAAGRSDFDQVLANNHIALDRQESAKQETTATQSDKLQETLSRGQLSASQAESASGANSPTAAARQLVAPAMNRSASGGAAAGELSRKDIPARDRSPAADGLDVIYVEATPQQLNAVLKDLAQNKSIASLGKANLAPASDEKLDAATWGRALRHPALRDWVVRNLQNLPVQISGHEKEFDQPAKDFFAGSGWDSTPAASPPAQAEMASSDEVRTHSALVTNPLRLQRVLFVLRPANVAAATSPPSDKTTPAESTAPAAEKP